MNGVLITLYVLGAGAFQMTLPGAHQSFSADLSTHVIVNNENIV